MRVNLLSIITWNFDWANQRSNWELPSPLPYGRESLWMTEWWQMLVLRSVYLEESGASSYLRAETRRRYAARSHWAEIKVDLSPALLDDPEVPDGPHHPVLEGVISSAVRSWINTCNAHTHTHIVQTLAYTLTRKSNSNVTPSWAKKKVYSEKIIQKTDGGKVLHRRNHATGNHEGVCSWLGEQRERPPGEEDNRELIYR